MSTIDESQLFGKIRDRPINDKLRRVLLAAAEDVGIDVVRVVSGGQPGSTGQRTGSTRHDGGNAADLQLVVKRRTLDFTAPNDLQIIRGFVTAAASHGATGIGAGIRYMGPKTLHVGFGRSPDDHTKLVWGAGGRSANAPPWLRDAARKGWDGPGAAGEGQADAVRPVEHDPSGMDWDFWPESPMHLAQDHPAAGSSEVERFRVLLDFIARHEGTADQPGGGYNTSLGFGRYIGGRERNLVGMTLDQIDALQRQMLANPANRLNSSALGRYQIVGKTLRTLRAQLGLTGDQTFSPAVQDRCAVALVKGRGRDAVALGQEWASLKGVSPAQIYQAYDARPDDVTPERRDSVQTGIPPELWATIARILDKRTGTAELADAETDWPVLQFKDSGEGVERLQKALAALNYHTGGIDGKFGNLTRGAVCSFQLDNGLPGTGLADAETWAALTRAGMRPLAPERLAVTADDLRKRGSVEIKNADRARYAGWVTAALGGAGLTTSGASLIRGTGTGTGVANTAAQSVTPETLLQSLGQVRQALGGAQADPRLGPAFDLLQQILSGAQQVPVKPSAQGTAAVLGSLADLLLPVLGSFVPGFGGSALTIGLGYLIHRFGTNIIERRVASQRDGGRIGEVGAG